MIENKNDASRNFTAHSVWTSAPVSFDVFLHVFMEPLPDKAVGIVCAKRCYKFLTVRIFHAPALLTPAIKIYLGTKTSSFLSQPFALSAADNFRLPDRNFFDLPFRLPA